MGYSILLNEPSRKLPRICSNLVILRDLSLKTAVFKQIIFMDITFHEFFCMNTTKTVSKGNRITMLCNKSIQVWQADWYST